MKTFAASVALVLILGACAAPVPSPSVEGVPSSTASPRAVDDDVLEIGFDDWTASCHGVPTVICRGVAGLFVNNLARNGQRVLTESEGWIDVTGPRDCPAVPDWADPSRCWQATAQVDAGPICMVIAGQKRVNVGYGAFGQVGGAEMAGRGGGPPSGWPVCE
jgi:hypothetical protein